MPPADDGWKYSFISSVPNPLQAPWLLSPPLYPVGWWQKRLRRGDNKNPTAQGFREFNHPLLLALTCYNNAYAASSFPWAFPAQEKPQRVCCTDRNIDFFKSPRGANTNDFSPCLSSPETQRKSSHENHVIVYVPLCCYKSVWFFLFSGGRML